MAWYKTFEEAEAEVGREHHAAQGRVSLAVVRDHRNNQLRVVSLKQARTWEQVPAETRRFWIEKEYPEVMETVTRAL